MPSSETDPSPFALLASLSNVVLSGEGLEFAVYRASSPKYSDIALRIPKCSVYENVNDPNIDSKSLLKQEFSIYRHLQANNFPVPNPYGLLEVDGQSAMLSQFVESDDSNVNFRDIGRVMAMLHRITLPEMDPLVAQEGLESLEVLPRRITRRWAELNKLVPSLSPLPAEKELRRLASGLERFPKCLLHMDLRDVNLRVKKGLMVGVVDWSNALIGPAAVDLYRLVELQKPGEEFLEGYLQVLNPPTLEKSEEILLRLDAAVMLALVFLSEAPEPERANELMRRVHVLGKELTELVKTTTYRGYLASVST